jgi:16S rRNA processing protein RimM
VSPADAPPGATDGGDPAASAPAGLVLVGRVAGAFGVRGEVRVTAYTADPLALLRYRDLVDAQGRPALTLEGGRLAKANELVARARGVADKTAADALRGLQLHVPRAALPPPEDEDEFYLHDLIGLRAEAPDGAPLGRIKAVFDHGGGDILELDPGEGRPTRLLPFTREVAPVVALTEGRIVIVEPGEVEADRP